MLPEWPAPRRYRTGERYFIRRTERLLPAEQFEPPFDLDEALLCRLTYQRPVADCPRYTEYFKEGDEQPKGRCELHSGSFEERAGRALDRVLDRIGRRLRRIFE